MRTTCLTVALLLVTNLCLGADDCKSSAATGKLCEKEAADGFTSVFDGKTLKGWEGKDHGYAVEDGVLVCREKVGRNLFLAKEYADFVFRFEYRLGPGGNNGVGIRATLEGTPAYTGMEIQILDDTHSKWAGLEPYQYNGSVYGAVAAKKGHHKPVGQWNAMEIMGKGSRIKVALNGTVIVDVDLDTVGPKSIHGGELKGLHNTKGRIGFCGHGDRLEFRNIRVKTL